ncbi:MAG: response receiver-modulated diguanylate cyclase [Deltaproteobacteria bacterium]|nr:response receiver-modulated diguanylate cyclase [Deltaproteobacteria bacterium]
MLVAILEDLGHEVIEVPDGKEAWGELQKPGAPRLAILDWMMPEIEGIEICRRVRQMSTTDPPYLILLTAKDDGENIVSGLNAGANDYLTKPYRAAELVARIHVGQRMLALQTELNNAREALLCETAHDDLTGALNRRALYEVLSHEFSRARHTTSSLCICLCEIDLLKEINDKHGHLAGNDVLKGLVLILRSNLHDYDIIGRYGGEEFLVIAPGLNETEDTLLFERLRSVVADSEFLTQAGNISATVSMGMARLTEQESVEELIAETEEALRRARAGGRNRVAYAVDSNPS